jgi:hypothetical protein
MTYYCETHGRFSIADAFIKERGARPAIHKNGTASEELIEFWQDKGGQCACPKCGDICKQCLKAGCNGRD